MNNTDLDDSVLEKFRFYLDNCDIPSMITGSWQELLLCNPQLTQLLDLEDCTESQVAEKLLPLLEQVGVFELDRSSLPVKLSFAVTESKVIYLEINCKVVEQQFLLITLKDITRLESLSKSVEQYRFEAGKRKQEMITLNSISRYSIDNNTPIDLVLFPVVETIPNGFRNGDHLKVSICIRDEIFGDHAIDIISNDLKVPIFVNGSEIGFIQVWYSNIREIPEFLIEEEALLQNIAVLLGKLIEERENQEKLLSQQTKINQQERLEFLGKLAGEITHDFNNLLAVIAGFTDMAKKALQESEVSTNFLHYIDQITKGIDRGKDLSRRLLSFVKQEPSQEKSTNVSSFLKELHPILMQLGGSRIKLNYNVGDDVRNVAIDSGSMERILMNLVINSRDAISLTGTIDIEFNRIWVGDHEHLVKGSYVVIEVRDTGSGMVPEVIDKVMEPFFTTKKEGTGLGLSTVSGLVSQHGGDLSISSVVGEGTVVTIYLPALPTTDANFENSIEPIGVMNVVVVEDDITLGFLIKGALKASGFTVTLFDNPLDARTWLLDGENVYNVVVSDVNLPELNGIQLYHEISARVEKKVHFIFISGYQREDMEQFGGLPESANFIQKPFPMDLLVGELTTVSNSPS